MKTEVIIIIIFCWILICIAACMVSKETSKKEKRLLWLIPLAVGLTVICIIDILGEKWIHIFIGIISILIGISIRKCKELSEMLDEKKSYGDYYP